jgi:hypothetical protein
LLVRLDRHGWLVQHVPQSQPPSPAVGVGSRSVDSPTTGSARGELRNDHKGFRTVRGLLAGETGTAGFGVVVVVGTVAWVASFPISISI